MRNYSEIVSRSQVDNILKVMAANNIHVDVYPGELLGNYVCYDTKELKIKGVKPRKYLCIVEEKVNASHIHYRLVLTDKLETLLEYENWFKVEKKRKNGK